MASLTWQSDWMMSMSWASRLSSSAWMRHISTTSNSVFPSTDSTGVFIAAMSPLNRSTTAESRAEIRPANSPRMSADGNASMIFFHCDAARK